MFFVQVGFSIAASPKGVDISRASNPFVGFVHYSNNVEIVSLLDSVIVWGLFVSISVILIRMSSDEKKRVQNEFFAIPLR